MTIWQPAADSSVITDTPAASTAPLQGHRLLLARLAWLSLAGLIVVLLVIAVPHNLGAMQAPCTGKLCLRGQVLGSELPLLAAYGITIETFGAVMFALQFGCALTYFAVAGVIFWRRSDDWMALLGAAMLLAWGAATSGVIQALDLLGPFWWWCVTGVWLLSSTLVTYFFYLFPSGYFVPHWTRWLAPVWIAGTNLHDVLPLVVGRSVLLGRLTSLFFDAWFISLALAQAYRYRYAATPPERHQTRWVLFGVIVGIGGYAVVDVMRLALVVLLPSVQQIPSPFTNGAYYVLMTLVPLAFGVAILRARLYDIDILINRTLVYGALTTCIVGAYIVLVGSLSTFLRIENNLVISLVTTGGVAVLFQPLRDRLQQGVNRLMYGDRDQPYAVLSRLGQRIEGTLAPDAVLPTLVETVREALKLPYAAIAIEEEGERVPKAASGAPVPDPLVLPLVYQGETVGHLLLGPRAPGEGWNRADRRLLADLARQAGTAVHAVRLHLELQHARSRLVTAREEERRRLRRDLHDGLGPVLASLALQADTAHDLVRSDPDQAETLLVDLTTQAQGAVVDIRRLVYALRPPALDELGLAGALRADILAAPRQGSYRHPRS